MTIQELLETHAWDIEFNTKGLGVNTIVCRCGDRYGLTESYRAHLAEVLETHQREAKAEALEDASRELTHPMYGIIVCYEYCGNRTCPDCIRIRAARDAAEWLNHRAGQVRDGL